MEHIINFESEELITLANLFKAAHHGLGLNAREQELAVKLISHFQAAKRQREPSRNNQFTREEAHELLGGKPMA